MIPNRPNLDFLHFLPLRFFVFCEKGFGKKLSLYWKKAPVSWKRLVYLLVLPIDYKTTLNEERNHFCLSMVEEGSHSICCNFQHNTPSQILTMLFVGLHSLYFLMFFISYRKFFSPKPVKSTIEITEWDKVMSLFLHHFGSSISFQVLLWIQLSKTNLKLGQDWVEITIMLIAS